MTEDDPENLDELLDRLPGQLARRVAKQLNADHDAEDEPSPDDPEVRKYQHSLLRRGRKPKPPLPELARKVPNDAYLRFVKKP